MLSSKNMLLDASEILACRAAPSNKRLSK